MMRSFGMDGIHIREEVTRSVRIHAASFFFLLMTLYIRPSFEAT